MTFTAEQKRKAAEREVAMRRRVYPRWVAACRISQAKADEEIAIMEAIAGDYRAQESADQPKLI